MGIKQVCNGRDGTKNIELHSGSSMTLWANLEKQHHIVQTSYGIDLMMMGDDDDPPYLCLVL